MFALLVFCKLAIFLALNKTVIGTNERGKNIRLEGPIIISFFSTSPFSRRVSAVNFTSNQLTGFEYNALSKILTLAIKKKGKIGPMWFGYRDVL